jgi:hypothetical protein
VGNPLSGNIDIPKVGSVPKAVIVPIGAGAAAYIAWKYWVARSGSSDEVSALETEEYADEGTIPAVEGAYSSENLYGLSSSETTSVSDYGFTGTTNAQWSQYVTDKLVASETWSYTEIVTALGAYLGGKSLSSTQVQIVQAGIAIAGYPPVGEFTIIPGGDTTITTAPTGLKATTVTSDSVTLSWSAVPGATGYRVYRDGVAENVGASADTTAVVGGLQPGTKYTFHVAANGVGTGMGPKSSGATVTTKTITLSAPTGLKVVSTTKSSVTISWNAVKGAGFYRLYVGDMARGTSENTAHTIGGLTAGKKYVIKVKADATGGSASSAASVSATTKKK